MPRIPTAQRQRIDPGILGGVGIVDPANAPGAVLARSLGNAVQGVADTLVEQKSATAIARNQREANQITLDLAEEIKNESREADDFADNTISTLTERLDALPEVSRFVTPGARAQIHAHREQIIFKATSVYRK